MNGETHLNILKRTGVMAWNRWRQDNPQIVPELRRESLYALFNDNSDRKRLKKGMRANLAGINLSRADLSGAFLESVLLNGADLTGAILEGANLTDASLAGARLEGAILRDANLRRANLSTATLTNADLMYTQLNGANLEGADMTNCNIYGVSAWNIKIDTATKQSGLRIQNYNEPMIKVDDIELAQFIYLLLNRDKLRNVIDAMTSRGVLILGRFGDGGLTILEFIASTLKDQHYLPIIFDFERPTERNYTETVKILVGLARFVIVDLSGSSVPQELYATVPHYQIPFIPIIETKRQPYAMFKDLLVYSWVAEPVVFNDRSDLRSDLASLITNTIIPTAERLHMGRQELLDRIFSRA